MKSFSNPFEDNFDRQEQQVEDKNDLNEEFAAKAVARLDEMFKQHDLAEAQISYGYEGVEDKSKESQEKEEEFSLGSEEKVFAETIRALRDQGIDTLDLNPSESDI